MCDPRMRDRTVTRLADRGAEIWVAWDTSDLRKPYARALDRTLVPGYLTFTALGMTPDHRGILYHHLTHGNPPPRIAALLGSRRL